MRPYIGGFAVQPKDALEACPEAVQGRPVAVDQEVVVLKPAGQLAEVAHRPAGLDQPPDHLLGLSGGVVG